MTRLLLIFSVIVGGGILLGFFLFILSLWMLKS